MGDFTHARSPGEAVREGRAAFGRGEWASAFELLRSAAPEDAEDLERLATAAYLAGHDTESEDARARAHHEHLRREEVERAVRAAFWLGFQLLGKGERARGAGWLGRARTLLEGSARESVEQGYLLLPEGLGCIASGDAAGAYAAFTRAGQIGAHWEDADLCALACHSRGRALLRMGDVRGGIALLDEAMAAVEAGALSPFVVGDVYCSVIEGCLEVFDLRRAQEWTRAFAHWCDAQAGLVPYRGECQVRRAELLQLRGAWPEAADAARHACERLGAGGGRPAAGAAFYQLAELHRMRGEVAAAEQAYQESGRWRRSVQPGLALLRLAQGHGQMAAASIRRALDEAADVRLRSRLLLPCTDIMLACGDLLAARAAADELAEIATLIDAPLVRASAAQARGAVLLAEGDFHGALASLQQAWSAWQEVEAPYDAARTCELMARACRALGDHDAASVQVEAARRVFRELGAVLDLERVQKSFGEPATGREGKLTARELEVLRLVAAGRTNRDIAAELVISERTVDRHVSNILARLALRSRTAAVAYAYQHGLLPAPPRSPEP